MLNTRARRWKAAATAAAIVATAAVVLAAGGSIDTSFGTGGVATLSAGSFFNHAAVQTDGRMVAVGRGNPGWIVARFNVDGSLDTSFAAPAGYRALFTTSNNNMAQQVVIDSSGRACVCGSLVQSSGDADFAVVRLNLDGSLDSTFGTGGVVTTNLQTAPGTKKNTYVLSVDTAGSLLVQSDGKIIVGGSTTLTAPLTVYSVALVRYNTNGTLDSTFGTGGIAMQSLPSGTTTAARRIAIDSTGGCLYLAGNNGASLMRFTSGGAYDTAFGRRVLTADFGANNSAWDMAVQPDGRVLLSGFGPPAAAPTSPAQGSLYRYLADGTPDRSYGTSGHAAAGASTHGYALALQSDGMAVLCINLNNAFPASVARFDSAGVLDASFGTNGIGDVVSNFSERAVAIDAQGRIVVAGENMSTSLPALARWSGN